ncbi:MAG: UDP-N-acetylmuramoyl-tripeptide--D-alanyl-D-alanine ligase [Lachnospiraceae bacterium]|nr:UDP-N-acetylmuramoyl-tripeptide--D-alanyl-D-alanine ligase [Lachnospiraceae bacterium]
MKNMTLKNIAEAVEGELVLNGADPETEITGAELDSRKIGAGNLFFATVGERVDGHTFIPQVFEKGAACVICEKRPEDPKGAYILVKSSFEALEKAAEFYRAQLDCKVVAITGSVGKTSTKETIAAVLSEKYKVLKTAGNLNNNIGLPLMVLSIRDEHEIAVLELGISHFGEMVRMDRIARPDIAVITNIGTSHMENLGSQQGIYEEKSHIFDYLSDEGFAVLNGDDPILSKVDDAKGHKVLYFGKGADASSKIKNIVSKGLDGSDFELELRGRSSKLNAHISLSGEHMVRNAACAALIAEHFGLTDEEIVKGIAAVKPMSGRSNVIHAGESIILDDCYNANPDSMKAALNMLMLANGRKVAIMGDMFELGENEREMHHEVGCYASETGVDVIVAIGGLGEEIYRGALECGKSEKHYYKTKEEFFGDMNNVLKNGDNILVKASHGMHFEEIVEKLTKGVERS